MSAAVLSTLPAGAGCITVEIKVNFIRPATIQGGILKCEAKPIHIGRNLATAQGNVHDRKGNLVAHGVSTCSISEMNLEM